MPAIGKECGDFDYLGESLGLARIVGLYWDYDELDQPWACSREELDQAAIEALTERLNAA